MSEEQYILDQQFLDTNTISQESSVNDNNQFVTSPSIEKSI
jgi:hypothetical protein